MMNAADWGKRDGTNFSLNRRNRLLICATGYQLFAKRVTAEQLTSEQIEEYTDAFLAAAGEHNQEELG